MADLEDIDNTAPADSLYEGAVKINLIRARVDGLYTVLNGITATEANQVKNLDTTAITAAQWVYISELNQSLTTTSTVTFGTINAFTLGGKLTAGAVEIEGSAFDINGGTIDGVSLTDITMSLGSDADGDIYYRASNKLTRLAKGTEDQVLTMGAAVPEWAAGGTGAGDVVGPASATDNAIVRFNLTTGKLIQNSGITISDGNALTIGSGHTLDVSGGTLTLAANQISGDKVEGGTIAAITITALTVGATLKLEGGTYDTTIVPGTPTESVSYTWPLADGNANEILKTSGAGVLSWVAAGAGDVTAGANLTNNAIVRGNGGAKGVQTSGITITDADALTLAGNLDASAGQYMLLIKNDDALALRIYQANQGYVFFTFKTTIGSPVVALGQKLEAGSVEIEGTNFDINGGAIDNTVVGNGNPAAGSFTTLSLRSVGELRFFDNGNYVGFEAPALDANQIWVLPTADGAANEVLKTDGSGNLGWISAPGANAALSNLASVAINESLISDTDNTDDLGSDAKQWKDLYINGTANIDSLVADTAAISAGTITGITDLAVADGGTGSSNASDARTALGVAIDSNVLAYDAGLSNLAGIAMVANRFYYTSGDNTHVAGTVTTFARSILDDADEATFKATVNLETGTDVLAQQTIGIANDNLLEVDDADAADDDYAKFTAAGLEGRDFSEVLGDLGLDTGWIDANETWTYASATTFTISGDKTGKYQQGDKLKLTQTTVKYFILVSTAYADTTTTITVTGGTDYTLADAAITANYFSKMENPQGFPGWFNWTPTYGGFAAENPSTYTGKFCVVNSICTIQLFAYGTSNATGFTFTAPINPAANSLDMFTVINDNGAWQDLCGVVQVTSGGTVNVGLTLSTQSGGAYDGFTASGNKGIMAYFSYEL